MPLLEKASRGWRGRIAFLGIDTNDTKAAALAFMAQVHVTYPSAFDPNGTLALTYGLYGLPVTVFISANGQVQGRHIGELHADTLQAALSQAFPTLVRAATSPKSMARVGMAHVAIDRVSFTDAVLPRPPTRIGSSLFLPR
jgi:hypothetical protein